MSREAKFSGANVDRETFVFPVQLTMIRIGNLTSFIHTLLYVMTIHTYMHTLYKVVIPIHLKSLLLAHPVNSSARSCERMHWSGFRCMLPRWLYDTRLAAELELQWSSRAWST